jgi:hypothetical protein
MDRQFYLLDDGTNTEVPPPSENGGGGGTDGQVRTGMTLGPCGESVVCSAPAAVGACKKDSGGTP